MDSKYSIKMVKPYLKFKVNLHNVHQKCLPVGDSN